jgi:hypothetical protein
MQVLSEILKPITMSKCKQCLKPFTCGCQKAVALDGSIVCKTCLTVYNQQLNIKNSQPRQGSIAPSGVTAIYSGPGQQVSLNDL